MVKVRAKTFELGTLLASRRGLEVTRVNDTTYVITRDKVPLAWMSSANHLWTAYLYLQDEDGTGRSVGQLKHTKKHTSLQWCLDNIKDDT